MAGFRIGRGRDNRAARPQQQPRQQPYGQQAPQGGQQPYGYPPAPSNPQRPQPSQPPQQYGGGGRPYGGGGGGQQWPPAGAAGGNHGEPEYFGGPDDHGRSHGPGHGGYAPQGGGHGPQPGGYDPYAANNPGHTQAFSIGEDPYTQGDTYRAGQAPAPVLGPRLHWKELLRGIVLRPGPTFLHMRDYAMWGPALVVTFLYGLLAIFGFDDARDDAINATLSSAVPFVLTTGIAITISAFILGVVTHTLARQLGGDGAWQPTVGLSMLIMSLTDAPRVIVAMFLGGGQPFVQLLGWATWLAAGALLTTMVSKSHDLPWPKALGASTIQLLAILSIIKLGTF
ncbi:Yip1 family protein [Streptomyces sp. NPDC018029]|uniref:Yip1 family protein n=1 Tax=Streptomyces sp. NPDC018029 TaxID=3365032 RepID=UPI00378F83B9